MNDHHVPGKPDGLEITITAEDNATLCKLSKTSDITHCMRCMAPAPARNSYRIEEKARRYVRKRAPLQEAA